MKNLFSNIAPSSMVKFEERKGLPTVSNFRRKTMYFNEQKSTELKL